MNGRWDWLRNAAIQAAARAALDDALTEDARIEAWWQAVLTMADEAWLREIGVQP